MKHKDKDGDIASRTFNALRAGRNETLLKLLLEEVSTSGGPIDNAKYAGMEIRASALIPCQTFLSLYDVHRGTSLFMKNRKTRHFPRVVAVDKFYGSGDWYVFVMFSRHASNQNHPLSSYFPVWLTRALLFEGLTKHFLAPKSEDDYCIPPYCGNIHSQKFCFRQFSEVLGTRTVPLDTIYQSQNCIRLSWDPP